MVYLIFIENFVQRFYTSQSYCSYIMYLLYVPLDKKMWKRKSKRSGTQLVKKTINRMDAAILFVRILVCCLLPGFTALTSSET